MTPSGVREPSPVLSHISPGLSFHPLVPSLRISCHILPTLEVLGPVTGLSHVRCLVQPSCKVSVERTASGASSHQGAYVPTETRLFDYFLFTVKKGYKSTGANPQGRLAPRIACLLSPRAVAKWVSGNFTFIRSLPAPEPTRALSHPSHQNSPGISQGLGNMSWLHLHDFIPPITARIPQCLLIPQSQGF